MDELYAFSTKHIPAIPPAFTGRSATGSFTLFVGGEVEDLTLLALKYSSDSSDGYLLVKEISVGEDRVITISAKKTAELTFTAYNVDRSLSNY